MKILLHTCCSNCTIYPFKKLSREGHNITGLWFNPNIHPYTEYKARKESMERLSEEWNIDMVYIDEYGLVDFLRMVVGREKERCLHCYRMRLKRTAQEAKTSDFDAFSTTLTISPYQNIELIRSIGEEIAEEYGIDFYYEDFRRGFREAMTISKELGLYRQKYCGCIYSEMERYKKG
ncbi:MAG: hypothetical protein D6828_05580 [Nitrospirae bacterium]|nr:MAG: hypothetical protein D6828_05580 [Nitrospirota bacterium]